MKKLYYPTIIEQKQIAQGIFSMKLQCDEIAGTALPGQFINLYCKEHELLLPRPISICETDKQKGTVMLVYAVVGRGTESFSRLQKGDMIKVLGPLGNGFKIEKGVNIHMLVGGGIGVPPLVELSKHLKGEVYAFLGFAHNPILVGKLKNYGAKILVATEDGNVGFKGNVIELLDKKDIKGDMIYSCGPKPMLKAVSEWAKGRGIRAQVSMEERMACGIGVCMGCTRKIKKKGEKDWQNRKVCTDGPVFWSEEVIWDE
ncbi:MAG: dihydroorotate dehydrogenase electron transfer subunit [Natronincolaceae bacterium]|nr:dihydroorotate dehydrogenase electron transfer subunit [Bacillota bacterium]NLK90372.1 dihydroorotate dehydrogenase electron transfer subunit [Clostridiales bacterium]